MMAMIKNGIHGMDKTRLPVRKDILFRIASMDFNDPQCGKVLEQALSEGPDPHPRLHRESQLRSGEAADEPDPGHQTGHRLSGSDVYHQVRSGLLTRSDGLGVSGISSLPRILRPIGLKLERRPSNFRPFSESETTLATRCSPTASVRWFYTGTSGATSLSMFLNEALHQAKVSPGGPFEFLREVRENALLRLPTETTDPSLSSCLPDGGFSSIRMQYGIGEQSSGKDYLTIYNYFRVVEHFRIHLDIIANADGESVPAFKAETTKLLVQERFVGIKELDLSKVIREVQKFRRDQYRRNLREYGLSQRVL
ncbi:MAG: hypothetical protein MZV49_13500 [Rhodopseudomonas palustris]|nr:hypothetical protein [Rhodopseudomonas palustris]